MRTLLSSIVVVLALAAISLEAAAHATYTGYSGAPGSRGECANSCHGGSGGTIEVAGFPTEYTAGQNYSVTVSHSGGSMIKQFNGSCRIGTGSQNAGVITADANTVTYNVAPETNGVHLTTTDIMSGTFVWTAPAAGTGAVRLYIAGHQGSASGANTTLVLTATERTSGIGFDFPAQGFSLTPNYPNPFGVDTVLHYLLPRSADVSFEIYDLAGRKLEGYESRQPAGDGQFTWNATGYPSGVYFCRMSAGRFVGTQKMLVKR